MSMMRFMEIVNEELANNDWVITSQKVDSMAAAFEIEVSVGGAEDVRALLQDITGSSLDIAMENGVFIDKFEAPMTPSGDFSLTFDVRVVRVHFRVYNADALNADIERYRKEVGAE